MCLTGVEAAAVAGQDRRVWIRLSAGCRRGFAVSASGWEPVEVVEVGRVPGMGQLQQQAMTAGLRRPVVDPDVPARVRRRLA